MSWLRRLGPALICVFAVPVVFLLVDPFVEIGMNDDWSYIHMSKVLAETGSLRYDGWTQAMVGPQAYWGAAVIKLFGFSFSALRASMIPIAMGCALLMYSLSRWTGVDRWPAALASLSLTLCPVFVSVETTFMSDAPALWLFLLTAYCMLRATESALPSAVFWLGGATVAGFVSGAIRQVYWGAPFLMLPVFIFLRRKEGKQALAAIVMLLAVMLCVAATLHWFNAQPLTCQESAHMDATPEGARLMAKNLTFSILTIGAFCLPALVRLLTVRAELRAILFRGACAAGVVVFSLWHKLIRAPWFTNLITMNGILGDNEANIGNRPLLIIGPTRYAIGAFTILVSVFALLTAIASYGRWKPALGSRLGLFCWMTIPFCAANLAIVIVRSPNGFITDRYLIPGVAIALICVVAVSERIPARWPGVLSWATVLFIGAYSIAISHDVLREREAIAGAAGELTRKGVPRECIMGGYEYDGWTQIDLTGKLTPPRELPSRNMPVEYYFFRSATVVKPKYYAVLSKQNALSQNIIDDKVYYTWLPPGPRHLLVQEDAKARCSAVNSNSLR